MSVNIFAKPKNYETAVMLLKKRRKLEAYHDDLIQDIKSMNAIEVIHPNGALEPNNYHKVFALLTINHYAHGEYSYNIARNTGKAHFIKALKSVGIDTKNIKFEMLSE